MLVPPASYLLLDSLAQRIRMATIATAGDQVVLMLAMEWTIGTPEASPEPREWCLALCGLCAMVLWVREPELPMWCNALENGAERKPRKLKTKPKWGRNSHTSKLMTNTNWVGSRSSVACWQWQKEIRPQSRLNLDRKLNYNSKTSLKTQVHSVD